MKIDAKVKGGLAWAGLFVILAVPSADILFGKSDPSAGTAITADTRQVKPVLAVPASKTDPIETASAAGGDPVDKLLKQGKKLPSYISDADEVSVAKPAVVRPIVPAAATTEETTEVASLAPATETPPLPLPRAARPQVDTVAVAVPAEEQPLILDETVVQQREAALKPVEPFPLSDDGVAPRADETVVTGDQLEEWDSGSLADYLEKQGLLSDNAPQQPRASEEYDADGFYLDEGPNRTRRLRPAEDFWLF